MCSLRSRHVARWLAVKCCALLHVISFAVAQRQEATPCQVLSAFASCSSLARCRMLCFLSFASLLLSVRRLTPCHVLTALASCSSRARCRMLCFLSFASLSLSVKRLRLVKCSLRSRHVARGLVVKCLLLVISFAVAQRQKAAPCHVLTAFASCSSLARCQMLCASCY
jgi:hypothetical protein